MRTITITFDGDPYVPQLMEKVSVSGQQLEVLRPGSSFQTFFDDKPVTICMLAEPARLSFVDTVQFPCSQKHAEAMSDGIPIDCPRCG